MIQTLLLIQPLIPKLLLKVTSPVENIKIIEKINQIFYDSDK